MNAVVRLRNTLLLLWLFSTGTLAETPYLQVYGWPGYLPVEVLQSFTARTGLAVRYTPLADDRAVADNRSLPEQADLVLLPAHQLTPELQQALISLPATSLPALTLLNSGLHGKSFDPHYHYSRPLLWRNAGILRPEQSTTHFSNLNQLTQPGHERQLALLDDPREVFALAFRALNLPLNSEQPEHLQAASDWLHSLLPSLHSITGPNEILQLLRWEQIRLAHLHQGEASHLMRSRNGYTFTSLENTVTQGQAVQRMDLLVIPRSSSRPDDALKLLAHLTDIEANSLMALHTGYRSPLLTTQGQAPRTANWMTQRLTEGNSFLLPLSATGETLYQQHWNAFLTAAREAGVHVRD
ncbi:hypothetical protein [Marinospirillum alkaliphilum]|uniref:Spermidine/putrescine transport system substrate-binding protein n=1 Tax=Marinospirillum alkaliphilum DSM 21637 TaxID=1122209 RepID=A0A1K1TK99_9GAMM|nr:hypothetical protein [Marinospirillum alkaliphilum]SFX00725.1 spermidine/putrescine transport system substrate-binding protein [Marinospirillum alkaliphilum DSM 21637]